MFDPGQLLQAAQNVGPIALAVLAILAVLAAAYASAKLIGWGSSVTTLLGNHLRHDVQGVHDEIRELKTEAQRQTSLMEAQVSEARAMRHAIERWTPTQESRS